MENNLGNKQTMARNIKYYMAIAKVTRKELSSLVDVPYTTVCDWVNAKTYPRIDKIEKLAQVFGISKADLVEEKSVETIYGHSTPILNNKSRSTKEEMLAYMNPFRYDAKETNGSKLVEEKTDSEFMKEYIVSLFQQKDERSDVSKLASLFNSLSPEGQDKALEYLDFLVMLEAKEKAK